MSKAVTHEEVEDVLSSIRRLVSEDKRPLAGMRKEAPAAVKAPKVTEVADDVSDRLVLTPALRVTEDAPLADPRFEDDAPVLVYVPREAAPTADTADSKKPMMLFPSKDQGAQNDHAPSEDQGMFAADSAQENVDALVQGALQAEAQSALSDDSDDDDYSNEDYWDVDDDPDAEYMPLMDEAEEDEPPAVFIRNTGEERVKPAPVPETAPVAEEFFGDDRVEKIPQANPADYDDLSSEAEAPFFDGLSDEIADEATSAVPLTAKIAALEAAVSGIANDWEPDGDEVETLGASVAPAMAWEDDVALDANGAPVGEEEAVTQADEQDAPAPEAASAAEDQVIDEAALRDLVSEIVRAELQGALGERITRNVRKLVRREIHRALTAQELE